MYNPQIETLIHVADTRSFSKAADQMYITTVSVMNQINAVSDVAIERARQIGGVEQSVIRIGTSILRPCKRLIDLWKRISTVL